MINIPLSGGLLCPSTFRTTTGAPHSQCFDLIEQPSSSIPSSPRSIGLVKSDRHRDILRASVHSACDLAPDAHAEGITVYCGFEA